MNAWFRYAARCRSQLLNRRLLVGSRCLKEQLVLFYICFGRPGSDSCFLFRATSERAVASSEMLGGALPPICRRAIQWLRLPKSEYWVRCEPPSPILRLADGPWSRKGCCSVPRHERVRFLRCRAWTTAQHEDPQPYEPHDLTQRKNDP
jgi:hypothetical protein